MKINRKFYVIIAVLCGLIIGLAPLTVMAEVPDQTAVIITEVQTGGQTAGEEFIELYNTSNVPVDITGWQIRSLAAGGSGGGTALVATIAGTGAAAVVLGAHAYYVVRAAAVTLPEGVLGQTYSASLSKTDKTIALFSRDNTTCTMSVADAVAWEVLPGGTTMGEGQAVLVPAAQANNEKLLQRYQDTAGTYQDTDNNAADFTLITATPGTDNPEPAGSSAVGAPSALPSFAASGCTVPPSEETPPPIEEPETPPAETPEPPAPPNNNLLPPEVSELLPNPAGTDTDVEYVELHNPNGQQFDLSGYVLEAGTTTKYRHTFAPGTVLGAGAFQSFTGLTLNNTSGQARLLSPNGAVVSESSLYNSPAEGAAWAFIGGTWQWTALPTPGAGNALPAQPPAEEPPAEETPPAEAPEQPSAEIPGSEPPATPAANDGLAPVQLTELLPNPGSPQTDEHDEYIELYNPNDAPFDLKGYVLETGTTTKHRYTLPEGTLVQPKAYMAFFSADTGLSLSNTSGQARILDPSGAVISESMPYTTAKDNQTWAFINNTWQWTTSPTPNATNTLVAPPAAKPKAAAGSTASTKKKAATKGKSTAKPKTSPINLKADEQATPASDKSSGGPIHPGLLAVIGGFALLYGAYEYRHDLANKFHQFRSHRAARAAARQGAKGG